tara:strand:- start:7562 stop:7915 length:354 start_codon:yes stop_codon:yes gene_type:complete
MAVSKSGRGGARPGSGPKKRPVPGAEQARKQLWAAITADAKANGGNIFELLVKAVREDSSYRDKVIPAWRIIADVLVKGDTAKREISIEDKRAGAPVVLPVERETPTPPAEVIEFAG